MTTKAKSDVKAILKERKITHGPYMETARCSQMLKDTMRKFPMYGSLTFCQRESLEMIQHKIARILCGNPNEFDHWHDIAGYAELVPEFTEVTDA